MTILYFGGANSGKSSLAQKHTLKLAKNKPFYIATYDNSYDDKSMQKKIQKHHIKRKDDFILIEEIKNLKKIIKPNQTYLIECISMWLFNNDDKSIKKLKKELKYILKIKANIIFVLNDISGGLIPLDKQTKIFQKRSSIIGVYLAKKSHKVYEVKYGLKVRLK